MLVERNSLRAISRIKHCQPHTILHWLDLAGQHAAAVSKDVMHGLHVTQAQIDELWTFMNKAPCGRTLQHLPSSQGLARCAGDAYVPRLITCPSSWITP